MAAIALKRQKRLRAHLPCADPGRYSITHHHITSHHITYPRTLMCVRAAPPGPLTDSPVSQHARAAH
eukprot:3181688-Lingulodinium_polyedra.AAC.1